MNKFIKVVLILSGVLLGIGIAATIAAFAMGITWNDLENISIRRINGINYSAQINQSSEELVFEDIKNLKIESGAAVIRIYYAPVETVEVHYDSEVGMSTEVDDGRDLEIECGFVTGGAVDVLLPEEYPLSEIDLDIGAGQVWIENVTFRKLDADVGAGELIVEVPDAKDMYDYDVDCGLGEIVIGEEKYSGVSNAKTHQGADKSFDIDCGAGRVKIEFQSQ